MECGYHDGIPYGDDLPEAMTYIAGRVTPLCEARRIYDQRGEEGTQTSETQPSERNSEKPVSGVSHERDAWADEVRFAQEVREHYERKERTVSGSPEWARTYENGWVRGWFYPDDIHSGKD